MADKIGYFCSILRFIGAELFLVFRKLVFVTKNFEEKSTSFLLVGHMNIMSHRTEREKY